MGSEAQAHLWELQEEKEERYLSAGAEGALQEGLGAPRSCRWVRVGAPLGPAPSWLWVSLDSGAQPAAARAMPALRAGVLHQLRTVSSACAAIQYPSRFPQCILMACGSFLKHYLFTAAFCQLSTRSVPTMRVAERATLQHSWAVARRQRYLLRVLYWSFTPDKGRTTGESLSATDASA